jgi:GDP-L-fucose synthase
MCRAFNDQYGTNFICAMPTNLYGPNDNYDPEQSHVMAALIDKFYRAKCENKSAVTLWGTGKPRRELMYVDDAAEAALFLMERYNGNDPVNVGVGEDHSIRELAEMVRDIVGYRGEIQFDTSKPDGVAQKLLDMETLHSLGWRSRTPLREGLRKAHDWYVASPYAPGGRI